MHKAVMLVTLILFASICGCSKRQSKEQSQELSFAQNLFGMYQDSIVRIHSMRADGSKARSGTGFAINSGSDQKIITNKHITENQDVIIVESTMGSWISSKRKEHTDQDICILPVEIPINITPMDIDGSYKIRPGQKIFTIGHPLGMDIAIYEGMINSLNRGKLVFSAPLSEGASGSPLLTPEGKVIGICDSYVAGSGAQNYNLATPFREGWLEESYKAVTNDIDPYLSEYLKKISKIRKKIREVNNELEELGKSDEGIKQWLSKTQWTRHRFQESAENACISFSAVDWSGVSGLKALDLRQNEVTLLRSAGVELRKNWESHKKLVNEVLPPIKSFQFIGIKESEDFVTSIEVVGHRLSQFLESAGTNTEAKEKTKENKEIPKSNQKPTLSKELILALGTYKHAENKFFEVGSP